MAEALSYSLEDVKGMTKQNADALRQAGCQDTDGFLEACRTPAGRRSLATETGISGDDILDLANRADLMRVSGIGEKYGDLLEIAGVDTVPELAQRNPANLTQMLEDANNKHNLVKALPSVSQVEDWIGQAKKLDRRLEY